MVVLPLVVPLVVPLVAVPAAHDRAMRMPTPSHAAGSQPASWQRTRLAVAALAASSCPSLTSCTRVEPSYLQVIEELFTYWNLEDADETLEELEDALIVGAAGGAASGRGCCWAGGGGGGGGARPW